MKHIQTYCLLTLFLLLPLAASAQVIVLIKYGPDRPQETHAVEWEKGLTAQLALQHCAKVETQALKKWIFVSGINGYYNEKDGKVWYYYVNNRRADKMAYQYPVADKDTILWTYTPNMCVGRSEKNAK